MSHDTSNDDQEWTQILLKLTVEEFEAQYQRTLQSGKILNAQYPLEKWQHDMAVLDRVAKQRRTPPHIEAPPADTKVITYEELLTLPWAVTECHTGPSCWCRCITLQDPANDKDGNEMYIAPSGSLFKEVAEHIVQLHNASLDFKTSVKNLLRG